MSQPVLLLIIFLLIKGLYVPLNRRKSKYYWKLPIDDRTPLIPIFVIPYLGYFVYVVFTILALWNTPYSSPLLFALIYSYVISIVFWYVFPNGVKRPVIAGNGLFDRLLAVLYRIDEDTNGFPSAHVFVTLICAYFLSLAHIPYDEISLSVAALIILSTLFTKQHYILDILGGVVVFVFSVAILHI